MWGRSFVSFADARREMNSSMLSSLLGGGELSPMDEHESRNSRRYFTLTISMPVIAARKVSAAAHGDKGLHQSRITLWSRQFRKHFSHLLSILVQRFRSTVRTIRVRWRAWVHLAKSQIVPRKDQLVCEHCKQANANTMFQIDWSIFNSLPHLRHL